MKIFRSFIFTLILTISLSNISFSLTSPPLLTSKSSIVIETERSQVLFAQNIDERLHISIANKIMTAILSIENYDINSKITISTESLSAEGSSMFLELGEKYTVEDLLYAILLTSANDAAIALAEYYDGSIKSFVRKMNQKCTEIGLKNTYFINPTGLNDESQYTTAEDLAKLVKYALSNKYFDKIFSTKAKPWVGKSNEGIILANQNQLFWNYDGVDGGKTGYNDLKLHSAITTATKGNLRTIVIVLDSAPEVLYEETKTLLDYSFINYRKDILIRNGDILGNTTLFDKQIRMISKENIYYTHPISEQYYENFSINYISPISLPITKNKIIGIGTFKLEDNTLIEIDLYSDTEILPLVEREPLISRLYKENISLVRLIFLLTGIEILLFIFFLIRKIKQKI